MDAIKFIDCSQSSFNPGSPETLVKPHANIARPSSSFKNVWRPAAVDFNQIKRYESTVKDLKVDSRSDINKIGYIFDRKVSLAGIIARKCSKQVYNNTPQESSTQIESLAPKISEFNLANRKSLDENCEKEKGKNRSGSSTPNMQMFEHMRRSSYPELPLGDREPAEFIDIKHPKLAFKFRLFNNRPSQSLNRSGTLKSRLSSGYSGEQSGEVRVHPSRNTASLRLTIRMTQTSFCTQKGTSSQEQRRLDSRGYPSNLIDTNIDVESLLMKNEEFVRYLRERHNHIPRFNPNPPAPPTQKTRPLAPKCLHFGNKPKCPIPAFPYSP